MIASLGFFRKNTLCKLFAWLVLCAFLLRALIPVGYMPDRQALEKGVFKITICTMDGAKNILADQNGQPAQPHKKQADTFCPFGWSSPCAIKSAAPFSPALSFRLLERDAAFEEFFVAQILSPQAQPRAPPVFLFG